MNKSFLYISLLLLLVSCTDSHFKVSGNIAGAEGKMVYLTRQGLDKEEICDSARVSADGDFSLKSVRPEAPEFYTLNVDSAEVWLAVDSTERISIEAQLKDMRHCKVTGSEETRQMQQLKNELDANDAAIINSVDHFVKTATPAQRAAGTDSLKQYAYGLISKFKEKEKKTIQKNSQSLVAYYLLFKRSAYGISPFNVSDPADRRYFAIVANAWNHRYPKALRTQQLKEMMGEADQQASQMSRQQTMQQMDKTGYIDLSLPDRQGQVRTLSSLKGKTILLEFCYLAEFTPDMNKSLIATYNKLKSKNFDIYMVTYDKNYDVWRAKAAQYPWTVVLDAQEASYVTYNITMFPTNFVIGPDGSIVGKDVTLKELETYVLRKK